MNKLNKVPLFTVLELMNELEELEEEKSEGDDGLDARLVNALRQSATGQKVLLKIANDCLLSGKHPSLILRLILMVI